MCWSASASIAATALGGAATVYAAKKGVPKARTLTIGFFTLMELLQAISYIWINQCDLSANAFLTNLGFLHIAFQPPVVSAFMLSFISEKKRKKWFVPVMLISFLVTLMLLMKMIIPMMWKVPPQWMCKIGEALCGDNACTYKGNWHLAWKLPLLGFDPNMYAYVIPVFILPLFYGAWRIALLHVLFGPILSSLLSPDHNEVAAIWCLFSIVLVCGIFVKPLTRWLETPMRKK
jgi:hypothetical protein